MTSRKTGTLNLYGFDTNDLLRQANSPYPPGIVGITEPDYDKLALVVENFNPALTRPYYKHMPAWDLWFKTLSHLPPADAAHKYLTIHTTKDGVTLYELMNRAEANGHAPIFRGFGEIDFALLNNLTELRRFADFEYHMALQLAERGVTTSIGKFSVGTINHQRAQVYEDAGALTLCRYAGPNEPVALFEQDEYGVYHFLAWFGLNQSHGVLENAPDEEKWAAITQTYSPDWNDPASLVPAWLAARFWGLPDGKGGYGIDALRDVAMLMGEVGVDTINDKRLPQIGNMLNRRYGGGYLTVAGAMLPRLGLKNNGHFLRFLLDQIDDLYERFYLPNGQHQIVARLLFCNGPGHGNDWEKYNGYRTDQTRAAMEAYYTFEPKTLPALAWHSDEPEPDPDPLPVPIPPPAPEPAEGLRGMMEDPAYWRAWWAQRQMEMNAVGADDTAVKSAIKQALEL